MYSIYEWICKCARQSNGMPRQMSGGEDKSSQIRRSSTANAVRLIFGSTRSLGLHDICVHAENWQTPTSSGVNVAATRNSISRSCSNAFGAAISGSPGDTILFREIGSGSWIPKRDWKLSDEVRESGRNRWDTRAWRKSDDANFCGTTIAKFHWFRCRSRFE